MKELEIANECKIFMCRSGSHAYGTSTAHSDIDIRGVFIAPREYTLGCLKAVEQVEVPGEDTVIYELAKFIRLAVDCNPNIIELLFTDEENILFMDPAFAKLREHRDLFLSKKAKHTFSGYAMAQMKRIKGHHKWINSPQPKEAPLLLDFATLILPGGNVVSGDKVENFPHVFLVKVNATTFRVYSCTNYAKAPLSVDRQNIQHLDADTDKLAKAKNLEFFGVLIVQQDTYRIQHRMWKEYWQWKKNRNKARSALEEKYTFDTKHAMHLMRLMRMSHEIMTEGKVIVRRPDAADLLDIRNGKFDYDWLVETAERMDAELEALYETSTLPNFADREAINNLYMEIVQEYWDRKG